MKERFVILTIDTIAELFKDYCGPEDIPADAMPTKLLLRPTEKGRLAIEFVSDSWAEGLPPLAVTFKIKRMFAINGV